MAQYDGEITYLDAHLASFLDGVHERHPEALVILTSDHGESLVEHEYFFAYGRFCYEPTAHVPLVVAHPRIEAGRIGELVSLVDVLPTLVELIGLPSPAVVEGRSLLGPLVGNSEDASAATPVRLGARSMNSYPTLCLRTRRWKIILTPSRFSQPLDLLLETQFRFIGTELPEHVFRAYATELYDLESDPDEVTNLAVEERRTASELQHSLWTLMLRQQSLRRRLGEFQESGSPELDEDTLNELRTLGYVR